MARSVVAAVALVAVTACTSGQTAVTPGLTVADPAKDARAQLAVGTATIAAAAGASYVGLNVVATFRDARGNDAAATNTPTLRGPAGLDFGIAISGDTGNVLTGTLPSDDLAISRIAPPAQFPKSTGEFASLIGVFGYGFASDNKISSTAVALPTPCNGLGGANVSAIPSGTAGPPVGAGGAPRAGELLLPLFSNVAANECYGKSLLAGGALDSDPNLQATYYGGPPAWPASQGYGNFSFFQGYPLGFTDFATVPVAGTYALDVAYATAADYSSYGHATVTATLPQAAISAPLPVMPQPTLTLGGDGSGIVQVVVPAGVFETIVELTTRDCDFAEASATRAQTTHYSVVTHGTGLQPLSLSANLGQPDAKGNPTHTFCTNADYAAAAAAGRPGPTAIATTLVAVGFDYPAYESSYPFSIAETPQIAGGRYGTADVTTSYPRTISTPISTSGM